MGREITSSHFSTHHFQLFKKRLEQEQALLQQWFARQVWSDEGMIAGAELEAWLIDSQGLPLAINERYLEQLADPLVVAELARFNIELNVAPQRLHGDALRQLQQEFEQRWQRCNEIAGQFGATLMMIGILPTLLDEHLVAQNMSALMRYKALNEQILRIRKGIPLQLDIVGREHLRSAHQDVMLESAATSFQVHLQVKEAEATRLFNASIIASAATVAIAANSPFLFGKELWAETRIPLFEQAVESGGYAGAARGPVKRVTFGSGYVQASLEEFYRENLEHFPVLLPTLFDEPVQQLTHLRLHNGTIWRWNRPLIGFDPDTTPHLRIEHRVMAAGPTVVDMIANTAFYYGLVVALARAATPPESRLPFPVARDNFYAAARFGLDATIQWLDGGRRNIGRCILEELVPLAESGLNQLGIRQQDIAYYLGIIERRVSSGRNGAAWQRAFVEQHGCDMKRLTLAYLQNQRSTVPVHEWEI